MPATPHMQKALDEAKRPGRNLSNLERDLAAVWSRILDQPRDSIGAESDLVGLGADDEKLWRLASAIEGEFRITLTTGALAEARTLEGVGELIRRTPRPAYGHPKLPELINAGDPERAPVFCLGGLGAAASEWKAVAALIDPSIPVFGVEASGFDERGRPRRHIPGIAAYHVANIRELVGRRRVVVVGYSFGGRVAYEIARQLRADGQDVHVLLLDATARYRANRAPWQRGLIRHNLRKAWRRERRALKKRLLLRGRSLRLIRSTDERAFVRWVLAAQTIANRDYRVRRFDGPMTLLTVESWARDRSELLGWDRYASDIEVELMTGEGLDHLAIMRERGMGQMAPVLERHLLRLTAPADQPARRR